MPLQFRFLEKGPPFPYHAYSSSSCYKYSLIFKFEKAFEAIRIMREIARKLLRRYSFRNRKREASPSKQVGPISISNFEEKKQKDDLQQD